MSLTLIVPDDIAESVQDVARRAGAREEELLLSALRAHFPPLPLALQEEFDALERASDDDFLRFEQSEGEG